MDFITNLDQHNKMFLLLGGLQLQFDDLTANSIKRFLAEAVGKIYKIRTEKLHVLGGSIVNCLTLLITLFVIPFNIHCIA